MNTVDGGSGDDHVTAHAETEFSAHRWHSQQRALRWQRQRCPGCVPLSVDRMPQRPFQMSFTVAQGDDVLHAFNLTNSNSTTPVGINQLWGDEGNDTLEASHRAVDNTISDVTNYLDGGKGNDNLTANIDATRSDVVHALNQLEGGDGKDILTANLHAEAHGGYRILQGWMPTMSRMF